MEKLTENFKKHFNCAPEVYVSTGGRYEILGNHTDHNHGLCLVANSSLRNKCIAKKNDDEVIIFSEGYGESRFKLNTLDLIPEKPDFIDLAKGILFKLKDMGYSIGGFIAYVTSEVPGGSGVSSSAAIESLFCAIVSLLFNENKISAIDMAKASQYAENVYFKKPCGLLDQVGSCFSDVNFIDFNDISNPIIENVSFDLPLDLILIKSVGDHANLTPLYANIPNSMFKVSSLLNEKYLRDTNLTTSEAIEKISKLNVSDEEKNISIHFFKENDTVLLGKKAIENNDVETFLQAVRLSQESSLKELQNTYVKDDPYLDSPQDIIDKVSNFIKDNGAVRIHGGGFKGTVLVFVKKTYTKTLLNYLEDNYKDRYYLVNISKKAFEFKFFN